MKTWEYEALRNVRDAIAQTVVAECISVLRAKVELSAIRHLEAHFADPKNARMDEEAAALVTGARMAV